MRTNRTRLVRRLLVVTLLVVAAAVAWNLHNPGARPDAPRPAGGEGSGTKVGDMIFVRFKEGGRPVEVKAKAMTTGQDGSTMHLESVEATFPFVSEGKPAIANIRADRCEYRPQPLRAQFRGHVVVHTDDGLELETEGLDYDSEKSEVSTPEPVQFRRGMASGTSRGMRFRAGSQVELWADVKIRMARESAPPIEIEAGTANVSKEESRIYLNDGVVVRQGSREISSGRLQLNMADAFRTIQHAAAIEDVEVRIAGGAAVAGGSGGGLGEKRLRCRRLNVTFREGGTPADAVAVNPATLEVMPGPGQAQEINRLSSQRIGFLFDEQGRINVVEAYAGESAEDAAQITTLTTEPLRAGSGAARQVECKDVVMRLDPASNGLAAARFDRNVVFSEPGRRAWADRAEYDGPSGKLALLGREPRIADDGEASELRARHIEIGTRSRDVAASENVRHTMTRRRGLPRSGPGPEEQTVVVCRRFAYEAAKKSVRYQDNVLMSSGRDEIRAPLMVVDEPAEGRRRLSASGGVTATLYPARGKTEKGEPSPVQSRSRELVYEESQHRAVYTGDVEMRQGDIQTISQEVVVLLGREDGTVERVLAGAPVDVRQGERRATGERATYTPGDQTLVLVGEKVVVFDRDRRLEGRVLTFKVGSDTIRLDGRDEVRTEAVLKRREPSKH